MVALGQWRGKAAFTNGIQIKSDHFVGEAWLAMLVSAEDTYGCPIDHIIFAPGTRNNWCKYSTAQILLVTEGKGYYQEEGSPVQILQEGYVMRIPPETKNWYGATTNSWFAYITISTTASTGNIEWLEAVEDEYYSSLK